MLNINNSLTLTVRVQDYNIVAQDPGFIQALRLLTLNPGSGMNYELDNFAQIRLERDVDCKILTAYHGNELVGWAILSGEKTDFCFPNAFNGFKSTDGLLFEVYVQPQHRRRGIAAELLKTANRLASEKQICVCPWDETSESFYNRHNGYNTKYL